MINLNAISEIKHKRNHTINFVEVMFVFEEKQTTKMPQRLIKYKIRRIQSQLFREDYPSCKAH